MAILVSNAATSRCGSASNADAEGGAVRDFGSSQRELSTGLSAMSTPATELLVAGGFERTDSGRRQPSRGDKALREAAPWTVVGDVDKQWSRELAVRVGVIDDQPDRFVGTGGFSPALTPWSEPPASPSQLSRAPRIRRRF